MCNGCVRFFQVSFLMILVLTGGCKEMKEINHVPRAYILTVGDKEVLVLRTKPTRAKLEGAVRSFPAASAWKLQVFSVGLYSTKPGRAEQLLESASGETLGNFSTAVSALLDEESPTDGGK